MDEVLAMLEKLTGYTLEEVMDRTRQEHIILRRHYVFNVLHGCYGYGLSQIGRQFGYDHATVLHACRSIDEIRTMQGRDWRKILVLKMDRTREQWERAEQR